MFLIPKYLGMEKDYFSWYSGARKDILSILLSTLLKNSSPHTSLPPDKAPRAKNLCAGSPHPILVAKQFTCSDFSILGLNAPVTQLKNE